MIKRVLVSIGVVSAVAAMGPVIAALAASPKRHAPTARPSVSTPAGRADQLRETIQAATVSYTGNPPFSGVGYDAGRVFGRHGVGAVLQTVTFPSPKTCRPSACEFKAHFEVLYPNGGFSGTIVGYDALNSNGSTSTWGAGTITAGTGRYRGAHGRFKFRGSAPKNGYVDTLKVCGSARY
jgi:hypothetical protein